MPHVLKNDTYIFYNKLLNNKNIKKIDFSALNTDLKLKFNSRSIQNIFHFDKIGFAAFSNEKKTIF